MSLTPGQVENAIRKNAADPLSRELAPTLRALLGAPRGDGYTAEMLQQIAELQVSLGKLEDGVVGPLTRAALSAQGYLAGVDCSALWAPEGASASARREHYLALYRRFDQRTDTGRPQLLGIRGAYPFARLSHRMIHARRYDDAFVLITDADAVVFRGATHAFQRSFAKSSGAVASIRPGVYQLTLAGSKPPIFNVSTLDGKGDIPAFRDDDHDGVISEDEAARALTATGFQTKPGSGAFADQIQFHPGYDTIKQGTQKFSSIGCQTAPLAELERLERAGHDIDFVLANATELARAPGVSTNQV